MAITFSNTPKEIDFTGNPVSIKIHGTGYIKSQGSKALLSLQVLNLGPQDSDTISFNVLREEHILTFAGVPDDTGTQIQSNVEWSTPQYLIALAASLESIPFICLYYNISYSPAAGLIFLEAKEEGEYYSFTNIEITGNGLSVHQSIPGSDPQFCDNYSISSSIYEIISPEVEKILSLVHDPDIEGNAVINIGEKVKWKEWTAPIPDLSWNTSQHSILAKKFVCKCSEVISGIKQRIYTSPEIILLPGKIPYHQWPEYLLDSDIISGKKYFTVKSPTQRTWIHAKEFLNFMVPVEGHNIGIAVSVLYSDGSTASKMTEIIPSVAKYTLLTIPAGIKQLNIDTWKPDKSIYSYEIRIYSANEDENILLANPFSYQVIYQKSWYRQLLFVNHFGVWENINITGKAKRVISPTREISYKETPYNYNPLTPEKRSLITDTDDYIEINTGVMLNVSADLFKHLVETSRLFLISSNGYIPITMRDGSFEIQDETKDLISIKLQLEGIDGSDGLISHFGSGSYSEDYSNSYD